MDSVPREKNTISTIEMTRHVCQALASGFGNGDLLPELDKLRERYPNEKWIQELIEQTKRERIQYGWKNPVEGQEGEAAPQCTAPQCFKCQDPIELGLLCDRCRGYSVWDASHKIASNSQKKEKQKKKGGK